MTRQNTDYGYDIQKVYLEMFITDAESFVRCQGLFDPTTFDRRLQEPAKFIKGYVEEHSNIKSRKSHTQKPTCDSSSGQGAEPNSIVFDTGELMSVDGLKIN